MFSSPYRAKGVVVAAGEQNLQMKPGMVSDGFLYVR